MKMRALTISLFLLTPLVACSGRDARQALGLEQGAATTHGSSAPPATVLAFSEIIAKGPELRLSARTQALAGRHVRMRGFMARLELPIKGGFYLTPQPVDCDEGGGGTADLPLESVFVISRALQDREVPHLRGPVEVTGTFEVGSRAEPDGRTTALRIVLDATLDAASSKTDEVAVANTRARDPK